MMNYDATLEAWNNVTGANEYGLGQLRNTIEAFNKYVTNKKSVTTLDDEQTDFMLAQQVGDIGFRNVTV